MPSLSASATGADLPRSHRIHLLLLTDTAVTRAGGSERFLRNLVSLLPRDRFDITLVQLSEDGDQGDGASDMFAIEGVRLLRHPVHAVYGPRGWKAFAALRRLARERPFDIVQSQHEKSDMLNALLPRSAAAVRISNRRDMGFNKSARLRWFFRWINFRFDWVVAPAQPILDGLVAHERLDARRTTCIANGVDTTRFCPAAASDRDALRRALGIGLDDVVFVCVASLTPVKRHVDLLDAFRILRDRRPDARLLLIGDGPLRGAIEAQRDALGLGAAVSLLGNIADVETLLPAADVGVLASSTEGMSNALLEIMACGLPVVATAVGGNPRLVADGVVGRLVPALAPDAFAAAMVDLAESPVLRSNLGDAARRFVEQEYSLATMASMFQGLYGRLLALTEVLA